MTVDPDAPYLAGLFALTVATGVVDAVSYLALDHVASVDHDEHQDRQD
jgi:hypothetical protein